MGQNKGPSDSAQDQVHSIANNSMASGRNFSHDIKGAGTSNGQAMQPSTATIVKGKPPSAMSPFVGFKRPTTRDVMQLHKALAQRFGERQPPPGGRHTEILDTVVGTILSQNTNNANAHKAFEKLTTDFLSWDSVRIADPADVEAAIKCGGLAPTKTKWIQHILKTIHGERGQMSMEYLRNETKETVHAELERFGGIGKKSAAIINLFDIGHPDMAVDTHVFRYARQLGWVPSDDERVAHNNASSVHWPSVTRDSAYAHLDATFPDKVKYSMHLLLTDTKGGLPAVCGAHKQLAFDGKTVSVDGFPLDSLSINSGDDPLEESLSMNSGDAPQEEALLEN